MIRKVCLQPDLLWRSRTASAQPLGVAIGIERDDMPAAQVETVVALAPGSGLRAPILKISRSRRLHIFVIPGRGFRALLETAPRSGRSIS